MVQFCKVLKYGIEAYPKESEEYFMFYDTISDHPIFFSGEWLFKDKKEFLFYVGEDAELDRYTGKIPVEFGGEG